jgi:single-stranded DNA-binding protein
MFNVLIAGTALDEPLERLNAAGETRVHVTLSVLDGNGAQRHIACTAINRRVQQAILQLRTGDNVAISGHASINRFPERRGNRLVNLRVIATRVLTLHDEDFDELD